MLDRIEIGVDCGRRTAEFVAETQQKKPARPWVALMKILEMKGDAADFITRKLQGRMRFVDGLARADRLDQIGEAAHPLARSRA